MNHFKLLQNELPMIEGYEPKEYHKAFFKEEVLRFNTIAGTIVNSFNVSTPPNINERFITHTLMRSLLENYFWLLYIYDKNELIEERFNEYLNGFKIEYSKLLNEPMLSDCKDELAEPDNGWRHLTRPRDTKSLLAALRNDYGDKLDYLYFIFRITSFDVHGKNLKSLFTSSFNKDCNFTYLKIDFALDLISNHYLIVWDKIKSLQEVS